LKKLIYGLGTIFLLFLITGCEKEPDNDSPDKKISYIKSIPGGCNGQDFSDLKGAVEDEADTVIFTLQNDTLDVFVGINYICCAPFLSEATITNDSILMIVTDTCPDPYSSCYCRCICYYTWDFLFTDLENKEYFFKIILNDPREDNPIVFKQGTLILE